MSKYARKVDTNQLEIQMALIAAGYVVDDMSRVGCGVPDLMVQAKTGAIVLLEVKHKRGRLTKPECDFFERWLLSPVYIVRSAEEALAAMGIEDER